MSPAGVTVGVPWDGRAVAWGVHPRAVAAASSGAGDITRQVLCRGRTWGISEDWGDAGCPSRLQQLFLSADPKAGAANQGHIRATCGNGGC